MGLESAPNRPGRRIGAPAPRHVLVRPTVRCHLFAMDNAPTAAAIDAPPDADRLPEIPVCDITGAADPAIALFDAEADRLAAIAEGARRHYGDTIVRYGDRISRRWLVRNATPYADEIARVAARYGKPGPWFLNGSFEWSCTCAVARDPAGPGMRLLRVLDWPLDGLGANLVLARQKGPAGEFLNLTWPGFSGVVTALAPGRFAAALNQAPMPRCGLGSLGDWAVNRLRVWRSRHIPPLHLLRRVFETCTGYADARDMLCRTRLAISGIFLLAGPNHGEGCVIERTGRHSRVHDAPVAAANHWLTPRLGGRPRGINSTARQALMETIHPVAGDDFDWLASPILNPTTRLAAIMNPATGRLVAQGWESTGPATRVLRLEGFTD